MTVGGGKKNEISFLENLDLKWKNDESLQSGLLEKFK
jgi:hypothetical protein